MKRLLGGIFARSPSVESPRAAGTPRAVDTETSASSSKRWGAFLLSSAASAQPPATADQEVLRHVDTAIRGVAAHVKAAIAKLLDGEEPDEELDKFRDFVAQAVNKLQQQSCELTVELLKSYFSSSVGVALCEQTAFPSLVLDFVAKMRVLAMKEELVSMVKSCDGTGIEGPRHEGEDCDSGLDVPATTVEKETGIFAALVPSVELLMNCVVSIASNGTLMETYRCELPNVIALTAEEYPPAAVFIREGCSRALMAVPDRNFSAALAWYLLDCNVVVKTVDLMTNYTLASAITADTAVRALEFYTRKLPDKSMHGASVNGNDDSSAEAAAAAVSEALGLTRNMGASIIRGDASTPLSSPFAPLRKEPLCSKDTELVETFCLSSYDVQVGIKSILYVLGKTFRFTLALLDEFETSGGYTLLLRLLDTCSEEEIPTFLEMLTALIPLGFRSTENSDGTERAAENMLGARNEHAFAAMRDLLLKYVAGQDVLCSDKQRRDEHLVLQLLTQVLHIYTSDYDNFAFLEPRTRTLALLLMKLPLITFYDAQVIILRIVEYVCCAAQPEDSLAHEILSIVCGLLVACSPLSSQPTPHLVNSTSDESSISSELMLSAFGDGSTLTLSTLMCECLIKVLRDCESDVYKQKLSGFGLMDRGIYLWLDQIATCLNEVPFTETSKIHELMSALKPHLEMYGRMLCLMLRNNVHECLRFREMRAHQSLYVITDATIAGDILATPFDVTGEFHPSENQFSVMAAFAELAGNLRSHPGLDIDEINTSNVSLLQAGVESDLSCILESLQRFRGAVWRQILVLYILVEMLGAGGLEVSPLWKACQGYEILVALLSSFDFASSDSHGHAFHMMELVLKVLSITLDSRHGGHYNAEYFRSIYGYSTVASCILTSGVLDTSKREEVLSRVFDLISGGTLHTSMQNGEAVQIVFRLLPVLPTSESVKAMEKLLLMLESTDNAAILSKREQVLRVVRAGAFRWMCDPDIVSKIMKVDDPLRSLLTRWIVTVVLEESLAVPCLHDFFRLVGKTIPILLRPQHQPLEESSPTCENPEAGLLLLQDVLRNQAIRHVSVGKPQGVELTGRYVHIVNSADRVWPPSSGYSFSCWLRFPALAVADTQSDKVADIEKPIDSVSSTVPATLCEGNLRLTRDKENVEPVAVYGVLVNTTLKLFTSGECAAQNVDPTDVLSIRNATRSGPLEWSFWADTTLFRATCADDDSMAMWWRAMEQSQNLSNSAVQSETNLDSNLASSDPLLSSLGSSSNGNTAEPSRQDNTARDKEEGSACILSIYSLESSACFVRVFFEHSTGRLRFHTGSATTGPTMNPNPKRTSIVFDSVAIDDLRPTSPPHPIVDPGNGCTGGVTERPREWHHFAFTHRKAVVGSSLITMYIDGEEVSTKKLIFPSAPSAGSFQAFVGNDAQVCSPHSALSWKIGPAWLSDEVLPSKTIAGMFSLGPTFTQEFNGNSYRSVGDWPEALASSYLARAADRGIDVAQFSRRLQLTKLGQSCQRQWREIITADAVTTGAALIAESVIAKKEELTEGLRIAAGAAGGMSRKESNKVAAFRRFVSYGCDPSSFGVEIETLLGNCKLPEDSILFSLNTSCSDRSSTPVLAHTQVHYINTAVSSRLDLARSLPSVGGICQVIFPLLDNARRQCDFRIVFEMLVDVLRRNTACLAECTACNGYTLISAILCTRVDLIDEKMLTSIVRLAVAGKLVLYANFETTTGRQLAHPTIVDATALAQVVLNVELRKKLSEHLQCQLVSLLMDLVVLKNPNALFNARQLRRSGLFQWILTYLSDLGNEDCQMNQSMAHEMRWCFPKFAEPMFEAILQYVLSLLRAFLRVENHVDDFRGIAEIMLLSMASTGMHTRSNPIRAILLQFILHELENDSRNDENVVEACSTAEHTAQRISSTIVESILYREGPIPGTKKREERRVENGGNQDAVLLSPPPAENSSKLGKGFFSPYPVDGFANVLLDVIDQDVDNGRWVSTEALLSVRVVLSLAQDHPTFAEHLLSNVLLTSKLKRVLGKYSSDCCAYIPLLAYVSCIPIRDTNYHDLDTLSAAEQTFVPHPGSKCADQVWDIIGELLLKNKRDNSKAAREISVVVLGKIALQVETTPSFFASVCQSSGPILRILVQCLLSSREDKIGVPEAEAIDKNCSENEEALTNRFEDILQRLANGVLHEDTDTAAAMSIANACLNLLRAIMIRALYGGDEFGSLMMLALETLDDIVARQGGSALSRAAGQRCWLKLLEHIVQQEQALTSTVTLVSMKNICTVCVALSRYMVDTDNHHIIRTESSGSQVASCIGEGVLEFLLDCCEKCSLPVIAQAVGADEQQFFYGSFIYCTQMVVLNELSGAHRDAVPSVSLLTLLLQNKHILMQQPSWEGLIECGTLTRSTTNEATGDAESANVLSGGGRPRRMHRIRSLSANAHKEFGLGAESDRTFVLSLAALLFRMLMNDSTVARHAAIVLWQFMIDQRFDVLKELLIAEPRTSLLHTITSTKKEAAVDVFHGGFDRLLYALHTPDGDANTSGTGTETSEISINQEIWCQFQLWLAENDALLADLIIARTETIYRHGLEVLQSCICLRKESGRAGAQNLSLETDFPVRIDIRSVGIVNDFVDENELERRDLIAKKALVKFSTLRDSALDAMSDGLYRWRDMSTRLAYTRNIWQTGKWQLADIESGAEIESLDQQSLFQRRAVGYCLDTTEGPQRMRVRLVQDYVSAESAQNATLLEPKADQQTAVDANPATIDNEPFKRSLEFHDAVEVFREFVYRRSTSRDNGALGLQHILAQCKMDSTRSIFADIGDANTMDHTSAPDEVVAMARKVYNTFLGGEDGSKQSMGISTALITEIGRIIRDAEEQVNAAALPLALFDAADVEATHYALCAVQHQSLRSLPIGIHSDDQVGAEREGSEDEADEDTSLGSTIPLDDGGSGDSDGEVTLNEAPTPTADDNLTEGDSDVRAIPELSSLEPTSPKPELSHAGKEVDTSNDAVYGSIARFIRRDDYPPIKSFNAAHIVGMGKISGLLVICRLGLYFVGGYTKLYNNQSGSYGTGDASSTAAQGFSSEVGKSASTPTGGRRKTTKRLLRAALNDLGMPFGQPKAGGEQFFTVVPMIDATVQLGEGLYSTPSATVSRWSIKYSNVKQFCRIKYQLRPVGIELFDTFGCTYFLQLETPVDREEVVKLLFQMPLVNSIFWSPVLRTGALAPSIKRIRQAVTKRWLRGSISNFEYLIHLNTLAGRSLNDITQYPVFPWVIADYTSEFLDLDARETFRDLSKPMGAIGETRAAQFCERYAALNQDMDADGSMETPAFHYGTHYSCSAYVINYLIRLEPFTALALELQGGVFDHPDRLFRSIPSSWASASRENLQDVRELIPEFFYLPEFLYNANNFKQTGRAAVEAQNVFMHFTYEGTVDIDQIEDPVMRAATLAQIENFGQTPSRIFSSPHPQRKVPTLQPSANAPASDALAMPAMNPSAGHQYDGITLSAIEAYVKWHTPLAPALVAIGKDYVFLKKHSTVAVQVNGAAIGDVRFAHDKLQCQGVGCTFMPPRFAKYLDWGNNSGVMKLRVHQQSSGAGRYREANKVLAVVEGAHQDAVNCAAISDDGVLLVTGGQDAVVNLIECSKASDGRRIFKQMAKFIGHTDAVLCVAINKEFNLIASSSADRSVLLWDLRTRALLQELAGHSATVTHVSINSAIGNVLTATNSEVRLWSINGDLLAASSSSAFGLQAITCAISTRCEAWQNGVVAVTGHTNGAIALWGLRYPSDLARQSKESLEVESAASSTPHSQPPVTPGMSCSSPSSSRRNEGANVPVSIQNQGASSSTRKQVVPSCQLFILKLLLDHRAKVTALSLGPEQRQLFSGDAEGNCIRWVDDSISTNIH